MALVAVDLVEGFFEFEAAAFEFDLDQRQAVDEDGDVVAVFVLALHADLLRDLVLILTPVLLVEKFEVKAVAIVAGDLEAIAEGFGALEDIAFVEVVEHFSELVVGDADAVVLFELGFEVGQQGGFVLDGHILVTQADELADEIVFENLFLLGAHGYWFSKNYGSNVAKIFVAVASQIPQGAAPRNICSRPGPT